MEGDQRQPAALSAASGELLPAAAAALESGRLVEAENLCQQILSRQPDHLPATHLLAIIAGRNGKIPLATDLLRKVVARAPRSVEALNQLAILLRGQGKSEEAMALCRQATRLAPKDALTLLNLGITAFAANEVTEASAALAQAATFNPRLADAHYHLGIALQAQRRNEEAVASYARAVALNRDNGDAHRRQGIALQQLGRFDEAVACFMRAIDVQPQRTATYADLFYAKKSSEADRPLMARMATFLSEPQMTDQDRANLNFALGKAFDDLGSYADAIRHFDEANRFKRAQRPFDRNRHAAMVEGLLASFTPDYFLRHATLGSASELPLLIVGMPRSGTTLVEQIISSHTEIGGGDELTFWEGSARGFGSRNAGGLVSAEIVHGLAAAYLALLQRIDAGARRITDKMPQNFFHLGLVHLVFPKARVIHCRRNPVDTCLSIYFTQFTEPQDYAYDRDDIAFYYEQYLRLMAHWRRVLPADRFLEIDYEELVADRERVTRKMIAFCGLDWDGACLHHEDNARIVRTASFWQARQPVYNTSVERWRRYEPWLGELRRLLPTSEQERRP